MHSIVLLRGSNHESKNILFSLMRNAKKIDADKAGLKTLHETIEKERDYFETIVVFTKDLKFIESMNLFVFLRNFTTHNGCKFVNINVDEKRQKKDTNSKI